MNKTLIKKTKPKKKEKTSIPLTIWTKPHGYIDLNKFSLERKRKYEIFSLLVEQFGKPSILWVDYFLNSYHTKETMKFLTNADIPLMFETFYDQLTNTFDTKKFHAMVKDFLKTWK